MKTTPILAGCYLALSSMFMVGCGKATQNVAPQTPTTTQTVVADPLANQDKMAQDTALSNPATVYCLEQGGKFTMSKSFSGSTEGYCTLPSNITCEVWAHYNGDCPAGAKKKSATTTEAVTKDVASTQIQNDQATSTQDIGTTTEIDQTASENAKKIEDNGFVSNDQTLTIAAEPGEDAGEIVTRWKTNGLKAPDGFIVMLSGQEQMVYPTKYFHVLKNPDSRSFVWSGLVPERTYFFRVCIADGESCKTYSNVANSLPK